MFFVILRAAWIELATLISLTFSSVNLNLLVNVWDLGAETNSPLGTRFQKINIDYKSTVGKKGILDWFKLK